MSRKVSLYISIVVGLLVVLITTAIPVSAASCGMHIYILNHNNLTLDVSLSGGGGNLDWGDGSGAYFGAGSGQRIYHGYSYNVGGSLSRTVTLTPDGGGTPCSLSITIDDNNVPTFCNLYGVEVGFNMLTVGADVQVGNAQVGRLDWGDGSYVDLGNGSGQHQWHSYSYTPGGQVTYTIALSVPHAPDCVRTFTIDDPSHQGWLSGGDAVNSYYPCPKGIGPNGITPGSYDANSLSQEQRQYLFQAFGNSGDAPIGYGGQGCSNGQPSVPPCPSGVGAPGSYPPESLTQQQRNELYNAFGHSGEAPVGYGGESCYGGTMSLPSFSGSGSSGGGSSSGGGGTGSGTGGSGGSGGSGSAPTLPVPDPANTIVVSFPYSPFGQTYNFQVFETNDDQCLIINGSTIVAQEISRFQSVYLSKGGGANQYLYVGNYFIPDEFKHMGFLAEIDTFRMAVESKMFTEFGCQTSYFYVSSLRMDMSGLGNIVFGYYMSKTAEDTEDRIANADQWFSDFFNGALNATFVWNTQDFPDDVIQRRIGRSIAQLTGSAASPAPYLIEQQAQLWGLF